jgi:hypothetical protein
MACNSCDTLCLDGGDDSTIQIEVPFQVSPQKPVYHIGDTITLSLFMDEFYSISTNESLPIEENLIKDYLFQFHDSTIKPQDVTPTIDGFEYVLDSNSRKIYYNSSPGRSDVLFYGNYDSNEKTISYTAKFIPEVMGFYILGVGWARSSRNQNLTDLTDDCGKEYYTLESILNQGKKSTRNVQLVENDTTLLRKTLAGTASELTIDSILNLPYFYYFYVEE